MAGELIVISREVTKLTDNELVHLFIETTRFEVQSLRTDSPLLALTLTTYAQAGILEILDVCHTIHREISVRVVEGVWMPDAQS